MSGWDHKNEHGNGRNLPRLLSSKAMRGVICVSAGLALFSVTAAPPKDIERPGLERLQNAIAAQTRHSDDLFQFDGVRGTGVGWRRSDGEPVVKVFTSKYQVSNLPDNVDGTPVVVEYVGDIRALANEVSAGNGKKKGHAIAPPKAGDPVVTDQYVAQAGAVDRRDRFDRPVPIGVSAGHPGITAGTIGCRVSQGCHTYALSNNHVFADSNDASIGDNILQPGPFDGGSSPADSIGTLFDYVPMEWHPEQPWRPKPLNYMDAALAESTDVGIATPEDGYGAPRADTMPGYVGQKLMKYGRTTGQTYGYIDALNVTIDVNYGSTANPKYARFAGQIIIKPATEASYSDFSLGGDSGSLIVAADSGYPQADCVTDPVNPCAGDYPPVADERRPVALLFAGGGGITVGNPIDDILDTFGVIIDGE